MNTCTVCYGDNLHQDAYCVFCGARLPEIRDTTPLGDSIASLAIRTLYYRAGQGLWFKLSEVVHVPAELGPLGIIGRGPEEDFDGAELVQPYRSTR